MTYEASCIYIYVTLEFPPEDFYIQCNYLCWYGARRKGVGVPL
jgi:hypothetical protein